MEELNTICAKWYNIGMQLRVNVDTLDAIKHDNQNNSSVCLRETLKTWLKTCPQNPTWNNIIDVLGSSVVGEGRLALYLEGKYCPAHDRSIPAIIPPVSPQQALTLMTPSPAGHCTQPSFPYIVPPQPHSPYTTPQLTPSSFRLQIPRTASPQCSALTSLHTFPISDNFVPADKPTPPANVTSVTHSSHGMLFVTISVYVMCMRNY